MKILKYLLLIIVVTSINLSCDDDICTSDTESVLDTEIIIVDENLIAENYLDNLSIYSPEWSDSIHYSEEGIDNKLSFMLSPNDSSTTIIITSKQEVLNDTIQIFHQNNMFFLSTNCGFILNFKIDTFINSNNFIDSTFIVERNITNDSNGHIQIYM